MLVRNGDRVLNPVRRGMAPLATRTTGRRNAGQSVQVIILAAGMGTRLGRQDPKPLTQLRDGRSILQRQLDGLRAVLGEDVNVTVVVGYRSKRIMKAAPELLFAYNPDFAETNTSKSLLRGLRTTREGGVLWLNGDVVFDPAVHRAGAADHRRRRELRLRGHQHRRRRGGQVHPRRRRLRAGAVQDRRRRAGRGRGHQLRLLGRQGHADRPPGRLRRPGLLRARHRDGDRHRGPARSARSTSRSTARSRWTSRPTWRAPTRCSPSRRTPSPTSAEHRPAGSTSRPAAPARQLTTTPRSVAMSRLVFSESNATCAASSLP